MFLAYHANMDLHREELVDLIRTALLRMPDFRISKGRRWFETENEDARRARSCASRLVDDLERCGLRWSKKPPATPHSAGE